MAEEISGCDSSFYQAGSDSCAVAVVSSVDLEQSPPGAFMKFH